MLFLVLFLVLKLLLLFGNPGARTYEKKAQFLCFFAADSYDIVSPVEFVFFLVLFCAVVWEFVLFLVLFLVLFCAFSGAKTSAHVREFVLFLVLKLLLMFGSLCFFLCFSWC